MDPKTPEREYNLACSVVRRNHSFFFNSKLTFERMCEISEWIGTLTKDQRKMLDDLLSDERSSAKFDANDY